MNSPGAGDGKRSWRGEGSAGAGGGSVRPKRFLGGSAGRRQDQSPTWFRLFVPITALTLVAVTIAALIWMLRPWSSRPLLVAWAVTDYQSPLIPLNEFALRDVQTISQATGFTLGSTREEIAASNLQTQGGFENFFAGTLGRLEDPILVVYVSAHGASRSDGGYLLVSESSTDPGTGYPVRRVIEQMARCPVKRKLLLLDATRLGGQLALGMLGNDFVEHVQRDFESVTKTLPDEGSSFWILVSSGVDERAWASRSLGHSLFGITAAYALRGGSAVDAPGDGGRTDGYLSAGELVEYISARVATWAPRFRDGAVQKPLCLKYGEDFRLIRTDESLTEQLLLAGPTPEAEKKPAAAAAKEPAAADAAAPAPTAPAAAATATAELPPAVASEEWGNAVKAIEDATKPIREALAAPPGDEKGNLTDDMILAGLLSYWKFRDSMADADLSYDRPHELRGFEQTLLRAEEYLLARQTKDAARWMEDRLLPSVRSLVRPPSTSAVRPNWSIAFIDPLVKEDPLAATATSLAALRDDPAEKNRGPANESPIVEARLLSMLASEFTKGEKWIDPAAVSFAYDLRKSAEQSAWVNDPRLLPLIKGRLDAADANRRAGERGLFLRRTVEAVGQMRQAEAGYSEVRRRSQQLGQSLQVIERGLGKIPSMIDWLGDDPPDRVGRAEDILRFDSLLADLNSLDLDSSSAQGSIETLARSFERIESQALAYAEEAWQRDSWRQTRAALRMPFLPVARRERLLRTILANKAESPFRIDARAQASAVEAAPANPFPIKGWATILGMSPAALEDLPRLGPIEGCEWTIGALERDPNIRSARARVGEAFRDLIEKRATVAPPSTIPEKHADVWKTEILERMIAPARSLRTASPRADDAFFDRLRSDYLERLLVEGVGRLSSDDANLPGRWYRPSVKLAADVARQVEPSFREPIPVERVRVEGDPALVVPAEGTLSTTLSLRFVQVGSVTPTRLVFDWFSDADRLQVSSELAQPDNGRLILPIPKELSESQWSVPLVLQRKGNDFTPPRLKAWVEQGDGTIDWLPTSVTLASPVVKPAELVLSWPDRGGESGVIELYPNQRLDLSLSLRKNVPEALPLRVEFRSGSQPPAIVRMNLPVDTTGEVPLAFPNPIEMPLDGEELIVRLSKESQLLEERRLLVKVLDVTQLFEPNISIDSDRREAILRVRRLGSADTTDPVPLAAFIEPAPSDQPDAAGQITPELDEGQFPCPLPAGTGQASVLSLSVAGVPRAFRWQVTAVPPVARPLPDAALRIVGPRDRSVFKLDPKRGSLPVKLHVDGLAGLRADEYQLRIGIDANDDSRFDASDTAQDVFAPGGRSVSTKLVLETEGPKIAIVSRVTDVNVDLRAFSSLGAQTVRAELAVGNSRLEARSQIFTLRDAPVVRLDAPLDGTKVPVGKPIPVTLAPVDELYPAIDSVEMSLDKNNNGQWDDSDIRPREADEQGRVRFDSEDPITVQLPSDGLELGKIWLLVRTRIRFEPTAGDDPNKEPEIRRSEMIRRQIEITKAEPSPEEMKPTTGTIVGIAKIGSQPARRVKVAAIGAGVPDVMTDEEGKFRFENVNPGSYTVIAASTQPLAREGQGMVKVEAGKESAPVEVQMSIKRTP